LKALYTNRICGAQSAKIYRKFIETVPTYCYNVSTEVGHLEYHSRVKCSLAA